MFKPWNRIALVSVCFKGGGGSNKVEETEANRASSEVALKNYNDYMTEIKPFQDKYIEDITSNEAPRQLQVAGQVNADINQKVGTPVINPNGGPVTGSDVLAKTLASAKVKGLQAVENQKAAGLQSVIDMGQGKATQAQLGLSELSKQSTAEAVSNAEATQKTQDATMSAGATGLGAAAGIASNIYSDSKKK